MMMGFEFILIALIGFCLIFPIGIAAIAAYIYRTRPQFSQTGQTPRELLQTRYAGGEITRDEYEQARQDLEA